MSIAHFQLLFHFAAPSKNVVARFIPASVPYMLSEALLRS